MSLEFKKIEVNSIQEMLPFYAMRHNMTCDSVFLESYVWKDYYNVRYAIWENKALLWLMENEGRCFSAMPLCREEDLPGAFAAIEEYFNEELGYPLVINLADEYAVKYLNLPEDKYLVEEQVDISTTAMRCVPWRERNCIRRKIASTHLSANMRGAMSTAVYAVRTATMSGFFWTAGDSRRARRSRNISIMR